MVQQRRWVSYIFRYRDYVRCEIAGFIKVQRISNRDTDVTRIRMGMRMYKEYPCTCYAYLLLHGQAKAFTSMQFAAGERDTILTSVELPWNNPLGDGIAFPEYEGVFFVCDDGEILAGIWASERYDIRQVHIEDGRVENKEPDTVQLTDTALVDEEKADTPPDDTAAIDMSLTDTISADTTLVDTISADLSPAETISVQPFMKPKVEEIPQIPVPPDGEENYRKMLATYPKLPLFAGSQIVDGVKIVPQDIGKLDIANWKLGVNSFLAHGYYKYQYLMLGKIKINKSEMRVIGVPGIFTNKERYLANMFGFRVFIPVRKTKIMTGNFGYWVSEVVGRDSNESASSHHGNESVRV